MPMRDDTTAVRPAPSGPQRIKVDPHVHTFYSPDSLMSLENVITMTVRRGLGALAITDHNSIEGALVLRGMAPFQIIVGEEIDTSEGEITGLFLEELIPPGCTAAETVARIKDQGGLVYVPHPFDLQRRHRLCESALRAILDDVDILEVLNARVLWPAHNARARRFAQTHGLLMSAGSDAHTPLEIGRAFVEMEPFTDAESFLHSLASARVRGALSGPHVHLYSTWAKAVKHERT